MEEIVSYHLAYVCSTICGKSENVPKNVVVDNITSKRSDFSPFHRSFSIRFPQSSVSPFRVILLCANLTDNRRLTHVNRVQKRWKVANSCKSTHAELIKCFVPINGGRGRKKVSPSNSYTAIKKFVQSVKI